MSVSLPPRLGSLLLLEQGGPPADSRRRSFAEIKHGSVCTRVIGNKHPLDMKSTFRGSADPRMLGENWVSFLALELPKANPESIPVDYAGGAVALAVLKAGKSRGSFLKLVFTDSWRQALWRAMGAERLATIKRTVRSSRDYVSASNPATGGRL
jgi:hypothetical protein